MVTLKELGDIPAMAGEFGLFAKTKIWSKDITQITPAVLLAAIKTLQIKNPEKLETIKQETFLIVAEAQKEIILGRISHTPIIEFVWPRQKIPTSVIVDSIKQFARVEQQAILLALSTGQHLRDVLRIKRKEVPKTKNDYELAIYRNAVPHINCPYLFWELKDSVATPLDGFEGRFMRTTKRTWTEFVVCCGNLIEPNDSEIQEIKSLVY